MVLIIIIGNNGHPQGFYASPEGPGLIGTYIPITSKCKYYCHFSCEKSETGSVLWLSQITKQLQWTLGNFGARGADCLYSGKSLYNFIVSPLYKWIQPTMDCVSTTVVCIEKICKWVNPHSSNLCLRVNCKCLSQDWLFCFYLLIQNSMFIQSL